MATRKADDVLPDTAKVSRKERRKYRQAACERPSVPIFTDFADPRFDFAGNQVARFNSMYLQWIHCIGNWGEKHSMCKKIRWMLERKSAPAILEKMDQRKALGSFDYQIYYGMRPHREFFPLYKPVKKNRKGAYEFWQDRDFEPLNDPDAGNWREKAPILGEMYVKGKRPV